MRICCSLAADAFDISKNKGGWVVTILALQFTAGLNEPDMIKKLYFILGLLLTTSSSFAQTVMLDYYFNHETKQDANRQPQRFHYLWEDTSSTGFSIWGQIFKHKGATLRSLDAAPTTGNLKGASVYIIVDPDSKKKTRIPIS